MVPLLFERLRQMCKRKDFPECTCAFNAFLLTDVGDLHFEYFYLCVHVR